MNILTLFHRSTTAEYQPPCDVADTPVLDAADQPAGYIGAAWGEWIPEDVIQYGYCTPDTVDAMLASWGLHRVPPEPLTSPDVA